MLNTGITVQRSPNLMIIKIFRIIIVVWKIQKKNQVKNAENGIKRIWNNKLYDVAIFSHLNLLVELMDNWPDMCKYKLFIQTQVSETYKSKCH